MPRAKFFILQFFTWCAVEEPIKSTVARIAVPEEVVLVIECPLQSNVIGSNGKSWSARIIQVPGP